MRHVIGAVTDDVDIVLPEIHGFRQPLSAAYRPRILPAVHALIAADQLKPAFLFDRCRVLALDAATMLPGVSMAALDPALASVSNLNDPDDYQAARAQPAPRSRSAASTGLPSTARHLPGASPPGPWVSSPTPSGWFWTAALASRSTATGSPVIASYRWLRVTRWVHACREAVTGSAHQ